LRKRRKEGDESERRRKLLKVFGLGMVGGER